MEIFNKCSFIYPDGSICIKQALCEHDWIIKTDILQYSLFISDLCRYYKRIILEKDIVQQVCFIRRIKNYFASYGPDDLLYYKKVYDIIINLSKRPDNIGEYIQLHVLRDRDYKMTARVGRDVVMTSRWTKYPLKETLFIKSKM